MSLRTVLLASSLACMGAIAGAPALALTPLTTQARIAIVVGNEDYATAPDLVNAARDAADMAALLESYGFTVFSGTNLDRRGFEGLLREAMLNTPEGADVVFFYAGHGIQIGRRNYLLPVDAVFESVHDLPTFSIVLDRVIDALASRGAMHLAIIDACRENPFPNLRLAADLDANIFEAQSGFEVVRSPLNSLVAFSTSPGEVALDGPPGANSPYTEAVLAAARAAPEESVLTLFTQVREQVYAATAGRQVPWESSTLVRPFALMSRGLVDVVPVQATVPQDGTAPRTGEAAALPSSAFVTLPLDRQVALADRIADALGTGLVAPALVTPPARGGLTIADDGTDLFYRPDFAEVRATGLDTFRHEDTFRIETGLPGQRAEVEVRLTLQALACDLQAGDALDLQGGRSVAPAERDRGRGGATGLHGGRGRGTRCRALPLPAWSCAAGRGRPGRRVRQLRAGRRAGAYPCPERAGVPDADTTG